MILIVLTEHDPLAAIQRMFRRFVYVFIPLSLLVCKYFPNIGVAYTRYGGFPMWVGLTTHKNTLAIVSSISAIFFLWNIIKRYRNNKIFIDIVLLLMSLYMLFLGRSNSATSIVVFFIGICCFMVLSKFKSKPKYITSFAVAILSISLLLYPVTSSLIESVVAATGRNMTFTGRTRLWQRLIDVGSNHSIFGSGYGSFWYEIADHNMWEEFATVQQQAHNGYLDVYLQIGLVGLFLLIVLVFVTYKEIMKGFEFNFEYCGFRMTLLTMVLIHNLTEATFLRGTNFVWFLFVLVVLNTPYKLEFRNSVANDRH